LKLLAALEESQQQKVTLKEELEDKINESNEFYKWWQEEVSERNIFKHELVEAQQTIARQQERERSIIYEVSEIHKEAAAGNSGSLERADTALKRIMLLSSNLIALGNKEGSDKA
jgi:hypothetical protein